MTPSGAAADSVEAAFRDLSAELRSAFREWARDPEPWPEERVSALARRAFALQHAGNAPYARYCDRLGVVPARVESWREIPAVPTEAFREVDLIVGEPASARLVFRTSGASRGRARRGRHAVRDPDLYRASLEAAFLRHVLDGPGRVRIGSLIPPPASAPDSSLSWMAGAVAGRFGLEGPAWLAGRDGVRWDEADAWARGAASAGAPVLLLATTLAADEWTRRLEARGERITLPPRSRAMDTGGAKGRPGLRRSAVVARLEERLGIRPALAVNEFGMTELLSQRYSRPARGPAGAGGGAATMGTGTGAAPETGAGPAAGDPEAPLLYGPPWLRTRALDPETLEELPEGEVGVLCHLDLANAGSVCAVLTEDLGSVRGVAVRVAGRAPGAPPRGCSLATAELLAAQGEA